MEWAINLYLDWQMFQDVFWLIKTQMKTCQNYNYIKYMSIYIAFGWDVKCTRQVNKKLISYIMYVVLAIHKNGLLCER